MQLSKDIEGILAEYFQQQVKGKKYQEKGFVTLINEVVGTVKKEERKYETIEKEVEELKRLQKEVGEKENANISRNTKQD